MRSFRATHRLVTIPIVVVLLYLAFTGTMVQLVDLRSIFTKAPASDPNVIAMREAFDGPGDYAVRTVKDYTAMPLPANADFASMLSRTMQSARMTVGGIPLRWVEFRMEDGRPVGRIEAGGRFAQFDAANGQIMTTGFSARTDPASPESTRNTWKHLHRMTGFGFYALYINVIVGIGLSVMIFTGLVMYFKMLRGRRRADRSNPFWSGGGWWRTWHRRVSVVAALFLIVVTLSGLWLAYESLVFGAYFGSAKQQREMEAFAAAQSHRAVAVQAPRPDPMSPEAEADRLTSMQHDVGLTDQEMVQVKAITDHSVRSYEELQKPGADPQEVRLKTRSLHQLEANAILAVLTEEERPRFQAWRDAQLLGMPLPERGQRLNKPQGPGSSQDHPNPQSQRASDGADTPNVSGIVGDHGKPSGHGNPDGAGSGNTRGRGIDPSSPLNDAELAYMLGNTLEGERAELGNVPIKVVRLRYYAGMPQGVVVTGGSDNKQVVFNANTGQAVSETEPGYPPVGFPFGWQAHQIAKDVHRGGIIGLPGRLMDLFSGLAMFYLSVSGVWVYVDLWKRRKPAGKNAAVWV